ncbi:hypothetical protein OS493_026901 [Desmophyllum pertusum]|uniref:Uncharacterized protein n=1 Tax=Desmophyllum pertusum TaxID=174260 RepID=A0A9W9ZAC6_9CNID|nr:hypothetical protein OS493_026901 [Desmophyllum pertusum]
MGTKLFNRFMVPTSLERKGLGGAINLNVACSGCGVQLQYASSMVCLTERRRKCVSLSLGLCFLIWGHGYPAYHKILKLGLGICTLTNSNFYNIVKFAHPCVKSVLDEICEMGKSEMKRKTPLIAWQLEEGSHHL